MSRMHNEMGESIKMILRGLYRYMEAYENEYGSPIGDDAVIGDEGWLKILKGAHRLLDGETGRLDPGDVSKKIKELQVRAGFSDREFDAA